GADDNDARGGRVVATLRAQCHGSNVGPMGALRAGNGNASGGVPFVAGFANTADGVLAFNAKQAAEDVGDTAPTLRAMPHDASHPNGGGQVAVVFNWQSGGDCRGLKPSPVVGALHVGQCPATMEGM